MAIIKVYRTEVDLESHRTQAVTTLKFYRPQRQGYRDIPMKIDTGSSITLLRNLTFQGLGVEAKAIGGESEATATNGSKFVVQQMQLTGALEIGKVRIENPIVYVTKPKTEQESKIDNARSNLLGFDLISCCANFSINMPTNFKLMTCQFLFRSDRLKRYCTKIDAPEKLTDEIEFEDMPLD